MCYLKFFEVPHLETKGVKKPGGRFTTYHPTLQQFQDISHPTLTHYCTGEREVNNRWSGWVSNKSLREEREISYHNDYRAIP